MTSKRVEEFNLLSNLQLSVVDLDNLFDKSCFREYALSSLRAINSSMLNERLDITLFEYNPFINKSRTARTPIARILHPFFSLGKLVVVKIMQIFSIYF